MGIKKVTASERRKGQKKQARKAAKDHGEQVLYASRKIPMNSASLDIFLGTLKIERGESTQNGLRGPIFRCER